MGELDRKKGVDFRKRVASLGSYCDEKKLAKEIDAFKLFDNDKSGKYHWVKDTVTSTREPRFAGCRICTRTGLKQTS